MPPRSCAEGILQPRPVQATGPTNYLDLDTRGLILKNLDRFEEGLEAFARARQLAEDLVREFPAVPDGGTTAINYPFTLVPSVVPAETEAEELP